MDQNLKGALELNGADACRDYHSGWAATYDSGFALDMDYRLPADVAAAFLGAGPVLDVGAGTGLLAERLREMEFQGQIDAADFSAEMLEVAGRKRLYDGLFQVDITQTLKLPRRYAGIVSSGTFTAGHVGPEAIANLLDVALPGALLALSINRRVWQAAGFDRALGQLMRDLRITGLQLVDVAVYGAAAAVLDADHAGDRALVALFRNA